MPVLNLLVVDDSPIDRRLAGALLEKHFACTVQYAADGKEAVEHLNGQLTDLVLTDLQMPAMNGLELVAAIKNDYPLVPVILMTAQGSEDIAAEALRQGAASYVPKRKLADDLVPTVERILQGSQEDRGHSHLMHYLESGELAFDLDNDLFLIQSLVNLLRQMLRCLPLGDETERLRVGVALEEALTNACYHGNLEIGAALAGSERQAHETLARERRFEEPYRDRRIHVRARIGRDEAVFVIRDDGPGFDVSRLTAPGLADAEAGVGRGVVLMRSIMDEVKYNDAGNEVTLVKRRTQPASTDQEAAEEV
jgi:CheY-like chemotaxis protein/anti-sigma regulatory factor (Ser/Thr protein kinase)